MKQSKYDSNKDVVCDAPECSNLVMINRNVTPWTDSRRSWPPASRRSASR